MNVTHLPLSSVYWNTCLVPHVKRAHEHVPGSKERCFMLWRLPDQKEKTTINGMKYHIWNIFVGKISMKLEGSAKKMS
jgi:hypothetical protein